MQYASREKKQKVKNSNAGSPMRADYEVTRTKEGKIVVKENGATDIYEKIQEQYEDTKIENILSKAQLGDTSGFLNAKGEFIDITKIPTDLHTIINTVRDTTSKAAEIIAEEQKTTEQPEVKEERNEN